MDLQDDQDRRSVSLFGFKAGDGRDNAGRACALPELEGGSGRRLASTSTPRASVPNPAASTPRKKAQTVTAAANAASWGEPPGTPVMTLDKRCLSCSGSASTVLAGFKLACLQYAPSPIMYQQGLHSRTELIRLRMDLLNQAKEQLRSIE